MIGLQSARSDPAVKTPSSLQWPSSTPVSDHKLIRCKELRSAEERRRLEQRVPDPPEQRDSNQEPCHGHQAPLSGAGLGGWIDFWHEYLTDGGCVGPGLEAATIFSVGRFYANP